MPPKPYNPSGFSYSEEEKSAGNFRLVGTLYAQGRGVPKSPSKAIDLYYKAGVQFRKANDREHALVVLDNMRETDETNPLTKKLCRSLYPGE